MKTNRGFIRSAGVVLCITAAAKIISGFGSGRVLEYPEPFFSISFKYFLWMVGVVELVVAWVCFFGRQVKVQAWLLAWLTSIFLFYRLGLRWLGHRPCSCLGNLTDALNVSPELVDNLMKVILAYLLLGSYTLLFWQWRQERRTSGVETSRPSALVRSGEGS